MRLRRANSGIDMDPTLIGLLCKSDANKNDHLSYSTLSYVAHIMGVHFSNATLLTQVFFQQWQIM